MPETSPRETPSRATAVVLAHDRFTTLFAKTAHGLVRGPSRFEIAAVIDPSCAGRDAGEALDGRPRGIPIVATLDAALEHAPKRPDWCVVGVATPGGFLPEALHGSLVEAAAAGMSLVSGLHRLLGDDPELARLARENGGRIVDLRRPRPTSELRFWSGEVLEVQAPRIAVLGTDCAVGKRTTTTLLRAALRERAVAAEMVYTGQTGWLQGIRHGFILDATPNDFVCGELERAILDCAREASPEVILLEGQSALRNPSGPCGSELLLGGAAAGVVLQHAPGRRWFNDLEEADRRIPPIAEEVALVRLLGSEVWAVTLNPEGLAEDEIENVRSGLAAELGLPVVVPLRDGVGEVATVIIERLGGRR